SERPNTCGATTACRSTSHGSWVATSGGTSARTWFRTPGRFGTCCAPLSALDRSLVDGRILVDMNEQKDEEDGSSIEQVSQDELFPLRRRDERLVGYERGLARDENRTVRVSVGRPPVRAFDEAGVERDDVEQHAKAKGLLGELLADLERRKNDLGIDE